MWARRSRRRCGRVGPGADVGASVPARMCASLGADVTAALLHRLQCALWGSGPGARCGSDRVVWDPTGGVSDTKPAAAVVDGAVVCGAVGGGGGVVGDDDELAAEATDAVVPLRQRTKLLLAGNGAGTAAARRKLTHTHTRTHTHTHARTHTHTHTDKLSGTHAHAHARTHTRTHTHTHAHTHTRTHTQTHTHTHTRARARARVQQDRMHALPSQASVCLFVCVCLLRFVCSGPQRRRCVGTKRAVWDC
jgi:hypothetical protein